MPVPLRRLAARAWRFLEDTAVAAGLYPAGAAAGAAQLAGQAPHPLALVVAWLTGTSVYLLDRVKLADRLLDPADALANPTRHAFITRHARTLRAGNALVAIAAATGAWFIHPLACALVILGHLVVFIYAHRPATPDRPTRVKDVFVLKNALVGLGIGGYVTILDLLAGVPDPAHLIDPAVHAAPIVAYLAIVITADAAASDLDDRPADEQYRTATLATRLGGRRTRVISVAVSASAPLIWLIAIAGAGPTPTRAHAAWSVLMPLTLAAAVRSTGRVRPRIDLRLPAIAAVVAMIA